MRHVAVKILAVLIVFRNAKGVENNVQVAEQKTPILNKATRRLLTDSKFSALKGELDEWRKEHDWVEDSALFYCLATFDEETKEKAWWTWPGPLRQVRCSPKQREVSQGGWRISYNASIYSRLSISRTLFKRNFLLSGTILILPKFVLVLRRTSISGKPA